MMDEFVSTGSQVDLEAAPLNSKLQPLLIPASAATGRGLGEDLEDWFFRCGQFAIV